MNSFIQISCLYYRKISLLRKLLLIQASSSMNNMNEKSEQHQNDSTLFSHDQILKHEQQQWDIKPDSYLQLQQHLTPGLSLKYELPAYTLNHSQLDQQCQDSGLEI